MVGMLVLTRSGLHAIAIVAHAEVRGAETGWLQTLPSTPDSITNREWFSQIPFRLFVTAKTSSYDDLPESVRDNLENTRNLNPGIPVTLFGDAECRDFIKAHYPGPFLDVFDSTQRGMYRGDLCRAAVLSVEGGFYTDLDFQVNVPFAHMVDNATTFMTSSSYDGGLLNAVIGAEPGSKILQHVMKAILHYYRKTSNLMAASPWMGVRTMLDGLRAFSEANCPGSEFQLETIAALDRNRPHRVLQSACGERQQIRLYTEQKIRCEADKFRRDLVECPDERKFNKYSGTRKGIFEPGPARKLVAWPRFASCQGWGCGVSSTDLSKH
jgi:hypothetical protein